MNGTSDWHLIGDKSNGLRLTAISLLRSSHKRYNCKRSHAIHVNIFISGALWIMNIFNAEQPAIQEEN